MYLARKKINGNIHYVLRESYSIGDTMASRDLMELGRDPSRFIVYPGGHAFYVDPDLEQRLESLGVSLVTDQLEDLFWPFIRPDVKKAVGHFRHRIHKRTRRKALSSRQEEDIRLRVHPFDKRRLLFLSCGNMDQGPVACMPSARFKSLTQKSRDEIEQRFMEMEQALRPTELKTYLYVALDLHRFFPNFLAKKMPQALDQDRVDALFLEEICRINQSLFGTGLDFLHEYLCRYIIMFFDNPYENSRLLDEFAQDFIYRHHFYRPPPPKPAVSIDQARAVFGLSMQRLKTINRKDLARLYRRLARKHHPDQGGCQEEFVTLSEAYQRLLGRLKDK